MRDLAEASAERTMLNRSENAAVAGLIPKLEKRVFNLMNRSEHDFLLELKYGIGTADTMLEF